MKLGAHQSIAGGIAKSIARAVADGAESLQIFVKNANRWEGKPIAADDAEAFISAAASFGADRICAHSSYLINLAAVDADVYAKSLAAMADELSRCDALGVPFFVVHPGAHMGKGASAGIEAVANSLNRIYTEHGFSCMTLLETTAGQGSTLGADLAEIEAILAALSPAVRAGVCLDTCHMFSAGYDWREQYDDVTAEVVRRFGDRVKVIHLNDSLKPFNSRRDRHALIGAGEIGLEPFVRLVNDARFADALGILETPIGAGETYAAEIAKLKSFRG